MKALVEHRGKQFIVEEGKEFKVPFLNGKVGEKVVLDHILYIDDTKNKEFGKPYLEKMSVSAKIVSHEKDDKVVVFKMKRRKGYQVKKGHRQDYTVIKIDKIKKASTKNVATKKTTKNEDSSTKSAKSNVKEKSDKKSKSTRVSKTKTSSKEDK